MSDTVIREEFEAAMQRLERADAETDQARAAAAAAAGVGGGVSAPREPTQPVAEPGAGLATRRTRRDDRGLLGVEQVGFCTSSVESQGEGRGGGGGFQHTNASPHPATHRN